MSSQRYVMLAFVTAALLTGWAFQAACSSGFATFAMPDNRLGGLVNTSTAVGLVAGAVALLALVRTRIAVSFTTEVIDELRAVTWPTRDETTKASTTVVLTTLFTASLLAIYDVIWKAITDLVL